MSTYPSACGGIVQTRPPVAASSATAVAGTPPNAMVESAWKPVPTRRSVSPPSGGAPFRFRAATQSVGAVHTAPAPLVVVPPAAVPPEPEPPEPLPELAAVAVTG